MAKQFNRVESLLEQLRALPQASQQVLHVCVVLTDIGPMLPKELQGFPVYQFDRSGSIVNDIGSSESPFVVAINDQLSDREQLSAFLWFILGFAYRQSIKPESGHKTRHGLDVVEKREATDEWARIDTENLMRVPEIDDLAKRLDSILTKLGFRLKAEFQVDIRPTRESILNSGKFFVSSYNTNQAVRDVIDRLSYVTVGRGYKISSNSEFIRRFAEKRGSALALQNVLAQMTRDAHIFGTSCMVIDAKSDIAIRLIQPDLIDFENHQDGRLIVDRGSGQRWPENSLLVVRGMEQQVCRFGTSILEPAMPLLVRIRNLTDGITLAASISSAAPPALLKWTTEVMVTLDRMRKEAEEQLQRVFQFPLNYLPLERDYLYFPGWETWNH